MDVAFDLVNQYALSEGFDVQPRTVLVEGTTDVALFQLAARVELTATGIDLMEGGFAIIAAGERDRGGAYGVVRQLITLRNIGARCLLPDGRRRYRFIGLFDNDNAGRRAIERACDVDRSIIEYKDVMRLWPVMPVATSPAPDQLAETFQLANLPYRGLDWELEDLLSKGFIDDFSREHPACAPRRTARGGKVHLEFDHQAKRQLHEYAQQSAGKAELSAVIDAMITIRSMFGLK